MKKIWLWILWCIILIGLLVLLYIKQTTVDTCTKGCLPNNMENKTDDLQGVKSICEDNWWIIQPYDDEWGNFSLCLFDDWSFCESWELYRWECGKWDKQFEDFLEAMSGSEGITAGEEQNESFYDWMRIKCIESWYNWVQWDCMSWENIIEIIDSDPYVDDYFDWFTWNIINWSDWKSYVITWDNTLYYNDNYWFAMKLWKEWNWAKIEIWKWCEECTETEYPHHIMINLLKPKVKEDWPMDWYSTISFSVVTKLEYEKMLELTKWDPMCEWDCIKDNTIWHNNHYYFLLGYTNQAPEDIINLFQWQLECDLIYPKWEEWTSSELLWDCTYALKKISSNYHFYNIMSDVPTILDD